MYIILYIYIYIQYVSIHVFEITRQKNFRFNWTVSSPRDAEFELSSDYAGCRQKFESLVEDPLEIHWGSTMKNWLMEVCLDSLGLILGEIRVQSNLQ